MKLNFWQWLGLVLFIVGAIGYFAFKDDDSRKKQPIPQAPPTTTLTLATTATVL